MSQLINILEDFRAGRCDAAQLLTSVAALLSESGDNVDLVVGALQQEHAKNPLPLDTFILLRKHLYAAAAPKTVALPPQSPVVPPQPNQSETDIAVQTLESLIPGVTATGKFTAQNFSQPASATNAGEEPMSPEETAARQAIGAVLAGRFRLVEFIGAGGTSRLYKAVDLRKVEAGAEDPHVAIKVLTLPFKDTLEALAVLNRETEGLQTLAHPNIVRVIDCDRDGDTVFMTMEFIRGKTLHTTMRGSRFAGSGKAEIWRIVHGIASAMEFAHSKFIVHGDLTPGNVMIASNGDVKVIDFGIARIFGQPPGQDGPLVAAKRSGSRGEITGVSPAYASLEMLEFRDPDPRDDIYSLACIVWELLTGSHPFGRRDAKQAKTEGLKLEFTDALTRIEFNALSRALQFERDKRTSSVQQFITELTKTGNKATLPIAAAATLVAAIAGGAYFFLAAPGEQEAVVSAPSAAAPAMQSEDAEPAPKTDALLPTNIASAPAAGSVFRDCPTCPLMTVIPPGEFMQGSPSSATALPSFEKPQHRVAIPNTFAASRTEVTVGEFAEFAAATNRPPQACNAYDGSWRLRSDVQWKNAIPRQTPSHPVSCVSWQDAVDYVQWLSARTSQKYRLPSASEWEYAARAGATTDRAWTADSEACTLGNVADQGAAQQYPGWTVHACNDAYGQTAPVASFAGNAFGLHDTLGNLFEWVADCWYDTYEGAPIDGSARADGDCSQREMRGGSWFTAPSFLRFAYRNRFASDYRSSSIGFRIVREIAP